MTAIKVRAINGRWLIPISYNKYKINWKKAPSAGQLKLQKFLYPYWKNQIVLAEVRIPGSKLRCDILNCTNRVVIEYSPVTHHGKFNKFFHKTVAGYLESYKRDEMKRKWVEDNDLKYVMVVEKDLKTLSPEFFSENFEIDLY